MFGDFDHTMSIKMVICLYHIKYNRNIDQINFAANIPLKWGKNLEFITVQHPLSKLNTKRCFVIFMDSYPALSIE